MIHSLSTDKVPGTVKALLRTTAGAEGARLAAKAYGAVGPGRGAEGAAPLDAASEDGSRGLGSRPVDVLDRYRASEAAARPPAATSPGSGPERAPAMTASPKSVPAKRQCRN